MDNIHGIFQDVETYYRKWKGSDDIEGANKEFEAIDTYYKGNHLAQYLAIAANQALLDERNGRKG